MKLILLGPPGSGKGTIAEHICKKLNIPSISTGKILRQAIKNNTKLGEHAKLYMDSGELVPDPIVVALISERINMPDCLNGFILDGFPRTIMQAKALKKICNIDIALNLIAKDKDIEKRMIGRLSCPKCGSTYHIKNIPPLVEGICNKCKSILVKRNDDNPNIVRDRLKTYHNKTQPLVNYYQNQGILCSINAVESIENVVKSTFIALGVQY